MYSKSLTQKGLQQNERREWESNLCPSASTGSQFQLTTPRPLRLTKKVYKCFCLPSICSLKSREQTSTISNIAPDFLARSFTWVSKMSNAAWYSPFKKKKKLNDLIWQTQLNVYPHPKWSWSLILSEWRPEIIKVKNIVQQVANPNPT